MITRYLPEVSCGSKNVGELRWPLIVNYRPSTTVIPNNFHAWLEVVAILDAPLEELGWDFHFCWKNRSIISVWKLNINYELNLILYYHQFSISNTSEIIILISKSQSIITIWINHWFQIIIYHKSRNFKVFVNNHSSQFTISNHQSNDHYM